MSIEKVIHESRHMRKLTLKDLALAINRGRTF